MTWDIGSAPDHTQKRVLEGLYGDHGSRIIQPALERVRTLRGGEPLGDYYQLAREADAFVREFDLHTSTVTQPIGAIRDLVARFLLGQVVTPYDP